MTAYLLHRSADGNMHLFGDGAWGVWDAPRIMSRLGLKVRVDGNFAYIIAGNYEFSRLFDMALVDNAVGDFDDLIANLPGLVQLVKRQLDECVEGPADSRFHRFQFCGAGWSQTARRVKAYTYEDSPLIDGPSMQLEPAESYMSPGPRSLASGAMNFDWPSPTLSTDEVRSWGISAMEAMRRVRVGVYEHTDSQEYVIGGYVQHVIVSPEKITSEIIHVWPDNPGQLIDGSAPGRIIEPVLIDP